MELLQRIDKALEKSGKTRADLARELGISTQAITSLGRRPNATMKHENLKRAAQVLQCDLDWLASGKGSFRVVRQAFISHHGEPAASTADPNTEMLASSIAVLFAQLPKADQDDVIRFMGAKLATLRTPEKV